MRVSIIQFAEVLYYWLSENLNREAIQKESKNIGFQIVNDKDFNKIYIELFILNMWLIVHTCEGIIEDIDKRNKCLDMLHLIVFKRHIDGTQEDYSEWVDLMDTKYGEYRKASEKAKTALPSPLEVIADVFNKKLFGEKQREPLLQFKLTVYIVSFVKYLRETLAQYEIE